MRKHDCARRHDKVLRCLPLYVESSRLQHSQMQIGKGVFHWQSKYHK